MEEIKIKKRDGSLENYDFNKIKSAIRKCFLSFKDKEYSDDLFDNLTLEVENKINFLEDKSLLNVELIQDFVEKTLMEKGYFEESKAYILYRELRNQKREIRNNILANFNEKDSFKEELNLTLKEIENDFNETNYSLDKLENKFNSFLFSSISFTDKKKALIRASMELTSMDAPKWEFISGRIYILSFYDDLKETLKSKGINDNYLDKFNYLILKNLYYPKLREKYSDEELILASSFINKDYDKLLTYSSFELLFKRYLVKDHDLVVLETPQEMFLGLALHLMMNEKVDRLNKVKDFYNILASLKVTIATPTILNGRKPYHQLSSCFVDTVPDSLDGIFRSIDNFAKVSKFGGGMGLYLGKVRANGAPIRGFKGAAGGVIRRIRIINDVAVAVDQLGVRSGACACYLDAWHKDLPEFLQLRTNNGDERMKAHDVFPGICYPNLFWELCKKDLNSKWYLLDPYEVHAVKGYYLEDYYGEEWEKRYLDCVNDFRISKREFIIKDLVRLIIKSLVETGTPFTFNRDIVNKYNPNKHAGMIYCSNLCTEIAQNMSPISLKKREITMKGGEKVVVEETIPGDFVVCNLASLTLGNIDVNNKEELEKIISITVRALDNVIDLNLYPLPYAKITNKKYRAIGLGVSGYHHMLTNNMIKWESEEHLDFVDKVFEDISYFAIKASNKLAKEKGKYQLFEGSDFDNGDFFTLRNYTSSRWNELKKEVHEFGLRNAYLIAIAPTSSTSIISATSPGVDPIMKKFFYEEKKGEMIPRVAPSLSIKNFFIYKDAHIIDQEWTIKAAGRRSRHVDQATSMNLYITNDFSMKQILNLYIHAYENEVKSIYYVRSKSLEIEECESCAS